MSRANWPAFPAMHFDLRENERGITIRDYLAAHALQGMLANPKLAPEILKRGGAFGGWIESSAYGWADAMLKETEE